MNDRMVFIDWGLIPAATAVLFLTFGFSDLEDTTILMAVNFISFFLFSYEKYRLPGNYLRSANKYLYNSATPDFYPLNITSAGFVFCAVGTIYFLAVLFGDKFFPLTVAAVTMSVISIIRHTVVFNIRSRHFYNPGMFTTIVLYLPLAIYFFANLPTEYSGAGIAGGIASGLILNYLLVYKPAFWFRNMNAADTIGMETGRVPIALRVRAIDRLNEHI